MDIGVTHQCIEKAHDHYYSYRCHHSRYMLLKIIQIKKLFKKKSSVAKKIKLQKKISCKIIKLWTKNRKTRITLFSHKIMKLIQYRQFCSIIHVNKNSNFHTATPQFSSWGSILEISRYNFFIHTWIEALIPLLRSHPNMYDIGSYLSKENCK